MQIVGKPDLHPAYTRTTPSAPLRPIHNFAALHHRVDSNMPASMIGMPPNGLPKMTSTIAASLQPADVLRGSNPSPLSPAFAHTGRSDGGDASRILRRSPTPPFLQNGAKRLLLLDRAGRRQQNLELSPTPDHSPCIRSVAPPRCVLLSAAPPRQSSSCCIDHVLSALSLSRPSRAGHRKSAACEVPIRSAATPSLQCFAASTPHRILDLRGSFIRRIVAGCPGVPGALLSIPLKRAPTLPHAAPPPNTSGCSR